MAASSSSPATSQEIKYDVFISFRGKDVRYNFLGHLHAALRRKSIETFVDDQLDRGDDIASSLFNTIKASKISVVIFSESYADSRWCLRELEQILDCMRTREQIVIPIFYKIEPSNVKYQEKLFGDRFAELQRRLTKRIYDLEGLKYALLDAAELSDWTINDKLLETLSIDAIVGDILEKLNILKHKEGTSGDAFANKLEECLEKRFHDLNNLKSNLDKWKAALKEVSQLAGWTVNHSASEIRLISEAVEDILKKLNKASANDNMDLVGAKLSIQEVESLLRIGSNDVRAIGIWGIGGIGKTTIGRVVFNNISKKFEGSYFAEDVRENSEKSIGQNSLKQKILSTILEDGNTNIGVSFTKERLGHKKVLIVFDDLTSHEQIKNIIGDFRNLGSGSRIIITTRDKQALRGCELGDDEIYEVKGLSDSNALQLFGQFAFGKNCPIDEDFVELSNKIVLYTKGVPLALRVLGSSLRGKPKQDWESELKKLIEYPNQDIQRVLRISYDKLDGDCQSIFLDIACFFKGWETNIVKDILDASGCYTQIGLSRLVDKSLISISCFNTIGMHDLLQEMGRYIVREECDGDPGQRSRLWDPDDIRKLFRKNTGTSKVQGIFFDTSTVSPVRLKGDAFTKMPDLRLLQVYNKGPFESLPYWPTRLSAFLTSTENKCIGVERLESLSYGLTYFHWEAYPSRSLPSDFFAEDLVRLDMRSSKLEQLWDDVQDLKKLKYVNLSDSTRLKKIPDLSKAKKLQELILNGCTSLENIDSIQYLNDLVNLDLSKCDSLSIVPDCTIQSTFVSFRGCSNLMVAPKISCKVEKLDLSGTAIKESPFIEYPSTLTSLDLSDCSKLESLSSSICKCILLKYLHVNACPKLKWLPDDLGNLEELVELEISGSNLIELPPSITKLSKLRSLCFSRKMDQEPLSWSLTPLSGFKFLRTLNLANCGITMLPDDLGQLCNLIDLDLSGNNFQTMPAMNNLHYLMYLDISNCESLTSLPELLRGVELTANNCLSLTTVSNLQCLEFRNLKLRDLEFREDEYGISFANCFKLNLLEMIHKESHPATYQDLCYPGHEIPNWFRWRNEGSSICLDWPPYSYEKRILVLMMAAVVVFPERQYVDKITVNCSFVIKWGGDKFDLAEYEMRTWLGDGFYIESDHIILGYYNGGVGTNPICIRCLNKRIQIGELGNNEVLIKFSAGNFEVKQCGLHVLLGEEEDDEPYWRSLFFCLYDVDEEDVDEEDINPIFRRSLLSCPNVDEEDVDKDEEGEDDVDKDKEKDCMLYSNNENEEGEEPQPKRLEIFNSSNAESSSRSLFYCRDVDTDEEDEDEDDVDKDEDKDCMLSPFPFIEDIDEEDEDEDEDEGDSPWHLNNENEEGEEPQPKRLRIFNSSNAESSSRHLDDENEEGEESQPKGLKRCNPSPIHIRICASCYRKC